MKLKNFFTIIIIIFLLAIGAGLLYQFYSMEELPREVESYGTPVPTPVTDQVYTNAAIGFGFRYPKQYKITREDFVDLSDVQERRSSVLTLVLEDMDRVSHPTLTLYVNVEVPIERAERTLTFMQDGKGIYLAEVFEDKTLIDEQIRTIGSIVMSDDNVYTWEFTFGRGEFDFGPELEAILATFGIYELETEREENTDHPVNLIE